MRYIVRAGLVAGLVFFAALGTGAQQPDRGIFGGGGGFASPSMLLQNEGVQKELKLSEEQIQKVKEVVSEVRHKYQEDLEKLGDLSREERREKGALLFGKIGAETDKGLASVLKPEQAKRLQQISIQQRGLQALADDEIQKALTLTEQQKESIKTISQELVHDVQSMLQGGGGARGSFPEQLKKLQSMRKQALNKGLALLTPAQTKKWKELTGDPYDVTYNTSGGAQRGLFKKDK